MFEVLPGLVEKVVEGIVVRQNHEGFRVGGNTVGEGYGCWYCRYLYSSSWFGNWLFGKLANLSIEVHCEIAKRCWEVITEASYPTLEGPLVWVNDGAD